MLILWIALGLVGLVIILSVSASIYLIFSSFTRAKNISENFDNYCVRLKEMGQAEIAEKLSSGKKALENHPKEDVFIMAKDGKKLHGVIIEDHPETTKTAILVHGYRGQGPSDFSAIWSYYKARGYRILVVDQRTHGQSEGHLITFGHKERYDLANWIEFILATYGEDQKIVIHGVSMGAATVMLSAALPENEGRITALIADCGYFSPKQQFTHMFKNMKLPHFPLFYIANVVNKIICGYWFGELHCGKALSRVHIPVLLVHGEADDFVPTQCSIDNFAYANEPKTLFLVPGAIHARSSTLDTEGYWHQLDVLLEDIT